MIFLNRHKRFWIGLLALLCPLFLWAQDPEPDDDLGNVSDAFQENFFEALKQKAILNYDRALEALEAAERSAKENPQQKAVVYFEKGKNYTALNKYSEAEQAFNDALAITGNRQDIVTSLYDVYYQTREYEKAINVVKILMFFDTDYKEDLANLYVRTQQFDKALEVLNQIDDELGPSKYRDSLRKQIFRQTGNSNGEISRLEGLIEQYPEQEENYLNLIFMYSESGDSDKAFATAQTLLEKVPDSELVHLALYKFYLEAQDPDKAISSMQIVFDSQKIDTESKLKVLADFMRFSGDNPTYEATFSRMVASFAKQGEDSSVYKQLGAYFLGKDDKQKALEFYALGAKNKPEDFQLLKNALLLQIDFKQFKEATQLSEQGLEIFPSQALLYLLRGVALNGMAQHSEAISVLEEGVDYVIEDTKMERDFYTQLSQAYQAINNPTKAEEFAKKARDLGMQ